MEWSFKLLSVFICTEIIQSYRMKEKHFPPFFRNKANDYNVETPLVYRSENILDDRMLDYENINFDQLNKNRMLDQRIKAPFQNSVSPNEFLKNMRSYRPLESRKNYDSRYRYMRQHQKPKIKNVTISYISDVDTNAHNKSKVNKTVENKDNFTAPGEIYTAENATKIFENNRNNCSDCHEVRSPVDGRIPKANISCLCQPVFVYALCGSPVIKENSDECVDCKNCSIHDLHRKFCSYKNRSHPIQPNTSGSPKDYCEEHNYNVKEAAKRYLSLSAELESFCTPELDELCPAKEVEQMSYRDALEALKQLLYSLFYSEESEKNDHGFSTERIMHSLQKKNNHSFPTERSTHSLQKNNDSFPTERSTHSLQKNKTKRKSRKLRSPRIYNLTVQILNDN